MKNNNCYTKYLIFILVLSYSKISFAQFGKLEAITEYEYEPLYTYFEDMDGDGFKDMIIQPTIKYMFSWFKNDGKGNFIEAQSILGKRKSYQHLILKDYDGDKDLDVLIKVGGNGNKFSSLILYKNDGKGNFLDPILLFDTKNGFPLKEWIGAEDYNSDGFLDFFFKRKNKIYCFKGNEKKSFAEEILPMNLLFDVNQMIVIDTDNDDNKDFVFVSNKYIYQYQFLDKHTYSKPTKISIHYDDQTRIKSVDTNNDNFIDLVLINKEKSLIYENDGGGGYFEIELPFFKFPGRYMNFALGDLDGDNKIDFIQSEETLKGALKWFQYKRNGKASKAKTIDFYRDEQPLLTNFNRLFSEDLNGDGYQDIIATSRSNFVWYENKKNGKFSQQKILKHWGGNKGISELCDITGDGYEDIVLIDNNSKGVLYLMEQNESKEFLAPKSIRPLQAYIASSMLVDLDNDGDQDILTISKNRHDFPRNSNLFVNLNNGKGVFQNQFPLKGIKSYKKGEYPKKVNHYDRTLLIDDLDQNGYKDLITLKYSPYEYNALGKEVSLVFQSNDGSFNFSPEIELAKIKDFGIPKNSFVLDFNQDGHKDIFLFHRSSFEDELIYFQNDGVEKFTQRKLMYFDGSIKIHLQLKDINNDNYADLISISGHKTIDGIYQNIFHNAITFYPNDKNGDFLEEIVLLERPDIMDYKLIDIDNDQDLDVFIITNAGEESKSTVIELYKNEGLNKFSLTDSTNLGVWTTIFNISNTPQEGSIDFLMLYQGHLHHLNYQYRE